jgi:histone H3/H4
MNTDSARMAVTAMCEVVEKLVGISASRLAKRMKRKTVKI